MAGVSVLVIGVVIATVLFIADMARHRGFAHSYRSYRRRLGRGILLGLELLVAADIIGTVAIDPSLRSVGILGGIVLIRTFLSFTIELEVTGRWPWQKKAEPPKHSGHR